VNLDPDDILDPALLGIQFDRFQRLRVLARIVHQVAPEGTWVLDVGGHPCELPAFLPRHRVVVADLPRDGTGGYVCADGARLPFPAGVFRAVVSADVMEHIPPERRGAFVAELFRVTREWVVLGLPRGGNDVHDAELAVDEYYCMLHGCAHPWLADHFGLGVPTRAQVEHLLRECGARFVRYPNGYLPRWTAGMLVNRYLETTTHADLRLTRFNTAYNRNYTECDSISPAYRDVYVATRGSAPLPPPSPAHSDPGLDPLLTSFLAAAEGADLDLPLRPSVTAVVVTYNHEACVEDCIRALHGSFGIEPEIIVVDNGSHDGSVHQALTAGATVMRTGRNLGFAAAFNLGWRLGRGEIVVSANPDVVADPEALQELVQACLEHGTAGVAGATLWNWDRTQVLHAGGEILPNYCTRHCGRGEPEAPRRPLDVQYVTGALMAMKRSVLEMLGGLDERYWPAYYEETDFCARVRERGMRVVYWPWAAGRHAESSTLGSQSEGFFRTYHRGRLRFIQSHLKVRQVAAFWRAERAFRAGRPHGDVEMTGLRHGWRGWWWRLPLAIGTRALKGRLQWRRS